MLHGGTPAISLSTLSLVADAKNLLQSVPGPGRVVSLTLLADLRNRAESQTGKALTA